MSRIMSGIVSSLFAVAVCCAVAAPAFAQDPPAAEPAAAPPPVAEQSAARASGLDNPGVDLGVRVGYALPFGNFNGDDKVSDNLSGAIPLVLEAGYRINANFTVGALFQLGIAQVKENDTTDCGGGVNCSAKVWRAGVEALYNFNLDSVVTPWVGLGVGYEWMTLSVSAGGLEGSATIKGWEFATLHVGADYRVTPQLALGPFASFSLAQYSSASMEAGGVSQSMDLMDKKMHEWLQLGVRGKFGI